MRLSLVGYMGSGKTSVGRALEQAIGLKFVDLDQCIEEKVGMNIVTIFEQKGELFFRKTERQILHEVCAEENIILSTGGGTPAYYDNMQVINAQTTSIYLHASPTALAQRLQAEKQQRPMIAHITDDDLPEFIAKHLFERNAFYQNADYTIATSHRSEEEVVAEILQWLKNHQSQT